MKKEKNLQTIQSSEAVRVGALLALVGGSLDTYTYLERGHVFANAQTGNFVMLGVEISQWQWDSILKYILPIAAFAVGILLVETVRAFGKARPKRRFHWRQVVLVIEAIMLIGVGFMPVTEHWNMLANSGVSFVCGMQVEAFRKVHGKAFATTMCTGNLRSGTDLFVQYFRTKDRSLLQHALNYYSVILFFILGAVISSLLVPVLATKTIWVSAALLLVATVILFADELKTRRAL